MDVRYVDAADGSTYPVERPLWRSPGGSHLNLTPGAGLRRGDIDTGCRSVWRYAAAVRVERVHAVSMGEGWTPLIDARWGGIAIRAKLEFMMPTGSFKDRGMTVMISYLARHGITHVLEDSSGNAGASLAAYAAAAGMRARILVPESASYPKIVQMAATGAEVVTIPGTRQDVADAALTMSAEIFYASHNWQAFFAEGTKTLAYELWEQLGFRAPDNVVVPLGYGSNVLGCEHGFRELRANGEIDATPRVFGVQAANCAPYFNAFAVGEERLVPTEIKPTVAEGIASSKPTRVREVLRAVRDCGGSIVAVSEDEIGAALATLARQGLYVEPTSAAAAAGLSRLIASGVITAQQTTVLVLTGSGLKAGERIGELLGIGSRRMSA
ncbi:MAG: threonine synthase [Burkholderiales bacterium]|nr:threonine synthase [Burkholderiales bacterium]